jgi:rhodanese-related sulfurtransferase
MMLGRTKPGGLSVLDKKVPVNPKYAAVRGELDTGNSSSKVRALSTKEFLKRQNELFSRVSARELRDLLDAEELREDDEDAERERERVAFAEQRAREAARGPIGDAERDRNLALERAQRQQQADEARRLLLLDLRSAAEFERCHVGGATSYAASNVSQDRFTPSMHRFKNRAGKMIVLYDEDEKLAPTCATALVQRGFENVRVLTGGLRALGNKAGHLLSAPLPEELVEHEPLSPVETAAARRERRERRREQHGSSVAGSRMGSPRSASTALSTVGASAAGGSVLSFQTQRSAWSRTPRWREEEAKHKELKARLGHPM